MHVTALFGFISLRENKICTQLLSTTKKALLATQQNHERDWFMKS
jgi:hypothetical protein